MSIYESSIGWTDVCECCGAFMETKSAWATRGGDGFGDRCCGLEDVPAIVNCEDCGAAYADGERCPEYGGVCS